MASAPYHELRLGGGQHSKYLIQYCTVLSVQCSTRMNTGFFFREGEGGIIACGSKPKLGDLGGMLHKKDLKFFCGGF